MITKKIIKDLYDRHQISEKKLLNFSIEEISKQCIHLYDLEISNENLRIKTMDTNSPFSSIPIKNIGGVSQVENYTAIVLRNSVLFLNNDVNEIKVHIKEVKLSKWEKIRYWLFRR